MIPRKTFRPRILLCPRPGCGKLCRSQGGLTQHINAAHPPKHSEPPATPPDIRQHSQDIETPPHSPHAEPPESHHEFGDNDWSDFDDGPGQALPVDQL